MLPVQSLYCKFKPKFDFLHEKIIMTTRIKIFASNAYFGNPNWDAEFRRRTSSVNSTKMNTTLHSQIESNLIQPHVLLCISRQPKWIMGIRNVLDTIFQFNPSKGQFLQWFSDKGSFKLLNWMRGLRRGKINGWNGILTWLENVLPNCKRYNLQTTATTPFDCLSYSLCKY